MSTWRGLFRKTRGTITLDTAAKTGSVDVTVDVASVDFGHDKLNEMAVSSSAPPILEATKFPEAHYSGRLQDFANGVPGSVAGTLTLHGIARPLSLRIVKFLCLPEHPVTKREVCGADAIATLNREDFGVTVGKKYGLDMGITLRI
jgi:polyisoprenoid-binding protein YceI